MIGPYTDNPNEHLLALLDDPEGANINVLEIGCYTGATLLELHKRYPNSYITGLDINRNAIDSVKHLFDAFVIDIENCEILPYSEGFFDYIIFGDVLEHLYGPLNVLKFVKKYLKQNGKILISIPNIMNILVIKDLLSGLFTYTDEGLLDKTHIHFFTYYEISNMIKSAGYKIVYENMVIFPEILKASSKLIDELMKISSNDVYRFMYEAYQYQFVISKLID